jgi:hypothetical protein
MSLPIDNRTLSLIISNRINEVVWDSFSDADWKLLTDKAQTEGVAPLVYWAFTQSGNFPSLPQFVQNILRASYAGTRIQNEKNLDELKTLSHLFAQADIPLVVLKGMCFILTLYPDIGLRPMDDIDVLVSKSKLVDAVRIARLLSYFDAKPEVSNGLKDLLNHEISLRKTGPLATVLEIHHSLVADKTFRYAVPVEWFWKQTRPIKTSPDTHFEKLLMLNPIAQVMYAASHAMLQHGGGKAPLCWYYDIDRLIRTYNANIDWNQLLAQAHTFKWSSALSAALEKVNLYFDTPVPESVRAELSKQSDAQSKLISLLQTPPATRTVEGYQTLVSLNWYGRLRLVYSLLIPNPTYMRWRYGFKSLWLLPFYYIYRWIGIAKDGLCTAMALIQGKVKIIG